MGAYERMTFDVAAQSAEAMRRSVAEGAYASPDEIVAVAPRDWHLAQRSDEVKLGFLRAAVKEGEESGPGIPAEEVYAELEALIATFEKHA